MFLICCFFKISYNQIDNTGKNESDKDKPDYSGHEPYYYK